MSERSPKQLQARARATSLAAAFVAVAAVILIALGLVLDANLWVVIPLAVVLIASAGALLGVSIRATTDANEAE